MAPRPDLPPAPPAFVPRRLTPRDLELAVGPGLRELPRGLRDEHLGRERGLLDRFRWGAPRRLRRLRLHLAGAAVALPLVAVFFTPLRLVHLPVLLPCALLYGALTGLVRPPPVLAGLGLLACVLLALVLTGQGGWVLSFPPSFDAFGACAGLFALGMAVGVSDGLNRGEE